MVGHGLCLFFPECIELLSFKAPTYILYARKINNCSEICELRIANSVNTAAELKCMKLTAIQLKAVISK